MKINLKAILPHIIVIAVFIIISISVFYPALEGYVPEMHDLKSHRGMSKEANDYKWIYDDQTLWTDGMFGGMPTYQISANYSTEILNNTRLILGLGLPFPIVNVFLYFLGFYILLLCLKIKPWTALFGAIAYGLSTYFIIIIPAGHNSKSIALSFAPALIGTFIWLFRTKKPLNAFPFFALFFALELWANHIQITYYISFVLLFLGVYFFIESFLKKEFIDFGKKFGFVIFASLLALGANSASLFMTKDYAKDTIRGSKLLSIEANQTSNENTKSEALDRDYITQWEYGKGETFNLMIPNAKGGESGLLIGDEALRNEIQRSNPTFYNFLIKQYESYTKGNPNAIYKSYWGNQPFTSGPVYIGGLIVFLALMGMIFIQDRIKWPLIAVSLLAILLSWGTNLGGSIEDMWLTNFFIDHIPLYNKFRAVSMILIIVQLTLPLLAVLFVTDVIQRKEEYAKNIKLLAGVFGGAIILFTIIAISPASFVDMTSSSEQAILSASPQVDGMNSSEVLANLTEIRTSIFQKDAFRSLLFILLGSGLLFFAIFYKKVNENMLKYGIPIGLAFLIFVDLWSVNNRYAPITEKKQKTVDGKYERWIQKDLLEIVGTPTNADMAIYQNEVATNPEIETYFKELYNKYNQDFSSKPSKVKQIEQGNLRFTAMNFNTHYRVFKLGDAFNDAFTSFFHKSTGGYHAAKLRRYQDIIEFYLSKEARQVNNLETCKVMNMMNTKYIIYDPNKAPIQNPFAYGNAWFVDNIKQVSTNDEEILAIKETDLKKTAIVHQEFSDLLNGKTFGGDSTASIQLETKGYRPDHLTYNFNSSKNELVVFSEVYYDQGWNAYIDGEKVDYLRANYVLRALYVPAGKHILEFKFEPTKINTYNQINVASSLLIMLLLAGSIYLYFKPKKNTKLSDLDE